MTLLKNVEEEGRKSKRKSKRKKKKKILEDSILQNLSKRF